MINAYLFIYLQNKRYIYTFSRWRDHFRDNILNQQTT
nr:MAG TPA: hypothetical protein [Caudoviricetes sp.]